LGASTLGGTEKLSLGDIFQSLDGAGADQGQKNALNTTRLRTQVKSLNKEKDGAHTLEGERQINQRKRARIEQQQNYEINQKKIAKFLPQVKSAREEVQSDFTQREKILHGGGISLQSVRQISANNVRATNDLEQ